MEFRQLEAFVAVADWSSFSEAARKLSLTQPAISAHIQSLEDELATQLIVRSTRSLALTKEGVLLYEYATSVLKLRKKIYEEFAGQKPDCINIGVSAVPSSNMVPDLLAKYHKKKPDLTFDVWQSNSLDVIEKVAERILDLGFVDTDVADEKKCVFEPLLQDELVIAAPATDYYKKLAKQPFFLQDFLQEPMIIWENRNGKGKEQEEFWKKIGISDLKKQLHVVAYMNTPEAIKKSIIKGLGISIIPADSVEDAKREGKIVTFSLGEYGAYSNLYIVYLKNIIYRRQIHDFVKFIRQIYLKQNANTKFSVKI